MLDPSRVFTDARVVALARSIETGDVGEVRRQITSGVDVKVRGAKGFTLTSFALLANKNAPEILQMLLKAGVDPISRLDNGDDVPHDAAGRDEADPDVVAVLLDAGISPNMVGGAGKTTLLNAAVSGRNKAVVSLLLARGADVNHSDSFTGTALHTAVIIPDYQIATLLLDHGADPHLRNSQDSKIRPDIPRQTPAELYCRRQSGRRPHPSPEQSANFEAMKAAFARRGVVLPCGI